MGGVTHMTHELDFHTAFACLASNLQEIPGALRNPVPSTDTSVPPGRGPEFGCKLATCAVLHRRLSLANTPQWQMPALTFCALQSNPHGMKHTSTAGARAFISNSCDDLYVPYMPGLLNAGRTYSTPRPVCTKIAKLQCYPSPLMRHPAGASKHTDLAAE
jgi:hypothetical protein